MAAVMTGMPGMQIRQSLETPFFDAHIEGRRPQILTLTIRVSLQPIPAPGSADREFSQQVDGVTTRFRVMPWTETEWGLFRLEFARVMSRFWSSKFVIHYPHYPKNIPALGPRPMPPARTIPGPPPPVEDGYLCRLRVVASDAQPHLIAAVVRLQGSGLNFVSWANREQRRALISQLGIEFQERRGRAGLFHNTAGHEMGHFLGLEHEGSNDPRCKKTGLLRAQRGAG
jgi:hypothetical protein